MQPTNAAQPLRQESKREQHATAQQRAAGLDREVRTHALALADIERDRTAVDPTDDAAVASVTSRLAHERTRHGALRAQHTAAQIAAASAKTHADAEQLEEDKKALAAVEERYAALWEEINDVVAATKARLAPLLGQSADLRADMTRRRDAIGGSKASRSRHRGADTTIAELFQ